MREKNIFKRGIASVETEIAAERFIRLTISCKLADLQSSAAAQSAERARSLQISINHAGNRIVSLRQRLNIRHVFILDMERNVELAVLLVKITLMQACAGS